jgi:hypothetical protein
MMHHMNWEYTDIALAPRAGKVDELRNEAASHRQSRDLIRGKRSQRVYSLRFRLAAGLAAPVDKTVTVSQAE